MPLAKPIIAGRAELEQFSRQYAAGVYYGDHHLFCRLLGELLAFVDTRDLMLGPRLALDGFWESWVTLAVARYVRPGMWCVDVGANYGYYTLLMASGCAATGRVVACEPNPLLAGTYLPQNLALNGFHHGVEICPKVVSDVADQEVDFILHESDFATSSIENWAYNHRAGSVRAKTTNVDTICADWPRLDLVKIDAEGAEALVREGMRKVRERFPRAAIILELHLPRDPDGTNRLLASIHADDYQLRAVNYAGQIASVTESMILSQPDEHWTLWLSRP